MFRSVSQNLFTTTATTTVFIPTSIITRNMSNIINREKQSPVCSLDWLRERMSNPETAQATVILDGSWHMPREKRNADEEFLAGHIPGALRFNIDKIADHSTSLPHMLPSTLLFSESIGTLGIGNEDHVVVYDDSAVYSAFRVYWMFKIFGHSRISVLDGGLNAWRQAQLPLAHGLEHLPTKKQFSAHLHPELLVVYDQLQKHIEKQSDSLAPQIVDARGSPRFTGKEPEPRPELSSGHMPGAFNVSYKAVVDDESHSLRTAQEICELFEKQGVQLDKHIITSCGSGVTACVLYAALEKAGVHQVAVYDGSWSEYASRPESKIVKDTADAGN
ncbi:rhodanese domain-containing protein [Syncephalis fuscata]|nr:rhodanese domain-containing protein [Syncephalis fuscata]